MPGEPVSVDELHRLLIAHQAHDERMHGDLSVSKLDERVFEVYRSAMEARMDRIESRLDYVSRQMWAILIALIALIGTMVAVVLRTGPPL